MHNWWKISNRLCDLEGLVGYVSGLERLPNFVWASNCPIGCEGVGEGGKEVHTTLHACTVKVKEMEARLPIFLMESAEASSSRDFSLQKLALKTCLVAKGSFTEGRAEARRRRSLRIRGDLSLS